MEASSYEPLACEDAKTPGLESDERLAPLSIIEELLHHMRLAGPLIFTHLMDYLPGMTNIVLVAQFQGPEVDANVTAVALSTMVRQQSCQCGLSVVDRSFSTSRPSRWAWVSALQSEFSLLKPMALAT
ncbi:hypothetical protein Ae201684P_017899 [Aphanomyces euteiches]|uniref:Uncharacterized protein n=1 Tax=Aphanomyces euteiches TaxID=100861 RepID=A0A6G0XMR3_9STRA|nr:hypothetical protein Ae201684_003376 [Aphanomyces euteiches]KAH9098688.1 hypothetical protein Ae201684P_017899 [Aphanomyces euteiches]